MKDKIAVEPASVLPKTELGNSKFYVEKEKIKFLSGTHAFASAN